MTPSLPIARFLGLFLGLCLVGCRPSPPAASETPQESSITNYFVRGVVKSLKPEQREVVIQHEEIPGYMMAMTMPFAVRDPKELSGIHPKDAVEFRMRVTEKDAWIDQIRVTTPAKPTAPASPGPTTNAPSAFRVLPNVPELKPGDLVPDYAFTNQLGHPIRLSQFRGQALAVTFIFTRCPYPLFCPRMSDALAQVQERLKTQAQSPTNWHLLSISFDPEYDTPSTMEAYGKRWKNDPNRWSLATGSMDAIEPFAVSVGLYFGRGVAIGDQNHNLRTLVISPSGKLVKVFVGNEWTPQELAEALVSAANSSGS